MAKEELQAYWIKYIYKLSQFSREGIVLILICKNINIILPRRVLYIKLLYLQMDSNIQ